MKKKRNILLAILAALTLTACKRPSVTSQTELSMQDRNVPENTEAMPLQTMETDEFLPQTEGITLPESTQQTEADIVQADKDAYTVILSDDYIPLPVNPDVIPSYTGVPYVDLTFDTGLSSLWEEVPYGTIILSDYDELGRCGSQIVHASKEFIPKGDRENTGNARPTGWIQNKYPGIVDSDPPFLYNRAHLLMWAVTGLTSEPRNLITGTRYFNTEAMLPTELDVVRYVENEGEVLYRVTPVFRDDNLLADGVLMEAVSKDGSFRICRFGYNVQPGIVLDYATGENQIEESGSAVETTTETGAAGQDYVLNTNSHKFHYPWCDSVQDIKEKNRRDYTGTRVELLEMGYDPCKRCNP